jgi:hypothetical protein
MKVTSEMVQAGLSELLHTANEDIITYEVAETYLKKAIEASPANEMLQALKVARSVMRDFGLWKPGTPDTDTIRFAIYKAEGKIPKARKK